MKLIKVCIGNFLIVAIPFWWITTICMIAVGMFDAGRSIDKDCEKPITRIEIVLPGHIVGCWLRQPVGFK